MNSESMVMLEISKLHTFRDHPYKVLDNAEMKELTESIAAYGVLSPIIVRPLEDTYGEYEVISGHRRLHASQLIGLESVPAAVMNISRDEAAIMVVDSNLHREHILPSEKAAAYKMKYDALKRTAGRPSKNASQNETNLRTDEIIASDAGESRATVQRYMRLTNLVPELSDLVDSGRIAFGPAVELSYLPEPHQRFLYGMYESEGITPTIGQAQEMKKLYQNGCLFQDDMEQIMRTEKANQKPKLNISMDKFDKYFSQSSTPKEIEAYIFRLLEEDFERRSRTHKHKDMER